MSLGPSCSAVKVQAALARPIYPPAVALPAAGMDGAYLLPTPVLCELCEAAEGIGGSGGSGGGCGGDK